MDGTEYVRSVVSTDAFRAARAAPWSGYLTDVDHHDHEALGALDHASGGGVGIGPSGPA